MERKFLAFDIETTKTHPASAYDWRLSRPLGISCVATCLSDADKPLFWYGGANRKHPRKRMRRQEAQRLVNYLEKQAKSGYTIASWNGLGFDFDILAEESGMLDQCR